MRIILFIEALGRGERWARRRAVEGLVFVAIIAGLMVFISPL